MRNSRSKKKIIPLRHDRNINDEYELHEYVYSYYLWWIFISIR